MHLKDHKSNIEDFIIGPQRKKTVQLYLIVESLITKYKPPFTVFEPSKWFWVWIKLLIKHTEWNFQIEMPRLKHYNRVWLFQSLTNKSKYTKLFDRYFQTMFQNSYLCTLTYLLQASRSWNKHELLGLLRTYDGIPVCWEEKRKKCNIL